MAKTTDFKMPHLDFITENKIDIKDEKKLGKTLSKALVAWQEGFEDRAKETEETLRNQWGSKLEKLSHKLLSDLEKKYQYDKDEVIKKEKREEKPKETPPKNANPKEEKPATEKKESKDQEKPDETLADVEKIIDTLWSKAENGELEIKERELEEAGVDCWKYLKMLSGQIGKYKFKSAFFSDTWTITKETAEA